MEKTELILSLAKDMFVATCSKGSAANEQNFKEMVKIVKESYETLKSQ